MRRHASSMRVECGLSGKVVVKCRKRAGFGDGTRQAGLVGGDALFMVRRSIEQVNSKTVLLKKLRREHASG